MNIVYSAFQFMIYTIKTRNEIIYIYNLCYIHKYENIHMKNMWYVKILYIYIYIFVLYTIYYMMYNV